MDKLDLMSTPPGRVNVGVDSTAQKNQERVERLRQQAAADIVRENQRAAGGDSVEISAEALALLRGLQQG